MSKLIKTAAAAAVAPALRLWQEFEVARSRPPGAVRTRGAGEAMPGGAGAAGQAAASVPSPVEVPGAAGGDPAAGAVQAAEAAEQAGAGGVAGTAGGAGTAEPARTAEVIDVEALRRRLEEERSLAFEAGRAEGAREALARVEEAVEREVAAVRAELAAFLEEERAYRLRSERGLVDLALAVAGRVVRQAVAADPGALLPLVAEAAARVGEERVRVRAHPREAGALAPAAGEGGPLAQLEVEADPALEPGDVILESPRGRYDLRPAVLLERVRRRLEDEVGPS